MLIDWFTVAAQLVNFLVLLALLKRFLFGPVIKLIDGREQRIAARLADADQKRTAAERQMEQVRADAARQQQECAALSIDARRAAEEEHKLILSQARESVRSLERKWRDDLDLQKQLFLEDLRKRAAGEVLSVARRAVNDLAGADLQNAAVKAFLEKLKTMDIGMIAELAGRAPHKITVLTPEVAVEAHQHEIREVLQSRLQAPIDLHFFSDPTMAWGIELRGEGRRIGWTPDTYLDSLQQSLDAELERTIEPVHHLMGQS